jgi:hypothetical protein
MAIGDGGMRGVLSTVGGMPVVELRRFGPGRTVGTLICDSGLKYLSAHPYATGTNRLRRRPAGR